MAKGNVKTGRDRTGRVPVPTKNASLGVCDQRPARAFCREAPMCNARWPARLVSAAVLLLPRWSRALLCPMTGGLHLPSRESRGNAQTGPTCGLARA